MIGKIPSKPKRGFVLPGHKFTGPYNPLDKQLDSRDRSKTGNEPFNAVDATSRREAVDKQLVRGIIGLKYKLTMSVWSSQLAD